MRKSRFLVVMATAITCAVSIPAHARQEAFIRFEVVDGDPDRASSKQCQLADQHHDRWIELESMGSQGVIPSKGKTAGPGQIIVRDKASAKESPLLHHALCGNRLTAIVRDGDRVYRLKGVLVTSYSMSGSAAAQSAEIESFSLNFEKITHEN